MPFEQGISGNPEGRPKGVKNKTTSQLRETINNFLENNFEQVMKDFTELGPKDRAKLYCDLLQYGLPRLQAIQLETEFDSLSDAQLTQIIEELKSTIDG
jgi:predicted component of type VI protein secretion system